MGDLEETEIVINNKTADAMFAILRQKIKMKESGDWWGEETPVEEKSEEELLREQYPAAQDAWEKYQEIIKLVKNGSKVG